MTERCRRHALTSCEECHEQSELRRLVWFTPDITSPIGGHIDELDATALTRLVIKNNATAYAAYTMGQLESRDAIRALEAANTALTARLAALSTAERERDEAERRARYAEEALHEINRPINDIGNARQIARNYFAGWEAVAHADPTENL